MSVGNRILGILQGSCHSPSAPLSHEENGGTIVIVGSPNVGKSVLFHRLTGSYVTVSNYPGTTVEVFRGKGNQLSLRGLLCTLGGADLRVQVRHDGAGLGLPFFELAELPAYIALSSLVPRLRLCRALQRELCTVLLGPKLIQLGGELTAPESERLQRASRRFLSRMSVGQSGFPASHLCRALLQLRWELPQTARSGEQAGISSVVLAASGHTAARPDDFAFQRHQRWSGPVA